jgi:hypothetical protein
MSRSKFSLQLVLGAVGLCAAAILPAAAQDMQAVQDTNSMTVTRDAETGKLRAATADEQTSMAAAKARMQVRMAKPLPLPKVHSSGARGVRVTDDFIAGASLIAVRTPDGKIVVDHGNPDVAQAPAQAPTTTTPATE